MIKSSNLNDICEKIVSGNSISAKEKQKLYLNADEGLPYIATKDVKIGGKIDYKNGVRIPTKYKNKFKISTKNSILICAEGGSAGKKIAYSSEDCHFGNKLFSIKCSKEIYPKFIYYYFLSSDFQKQFKDLMHGVIGGVSLSKFKKIKILYPEYSIQKDICKKLDETFNSIDEIISINEKKVKEFSSLYEKIKENIFDNIENYEEKKMDDVCEKITDGTHNTPKYFDEGYIFLSSKNVTSKKIDWKNVRYIDEKQHIQMQKRVSPKIGDVLLAKNGTTGIAAIVDKSLKFDIYVSLALLRSKDFILPEYLLAFINSKSARYQFSLKTKGIGVPNLHLKEIKEVMIKFPKDIKQQQKVVEKINNLDRLYEKLSTINSVKSENLLAIKRQMMNKELSNTRYE